MKKVISILIASIFVFVLVGCQKTLKDTDALIKKAREEIPIADAENVDMQYAGQCTKDDLALVWFISGNEYQAHYYLPMECTIIDEDTYAFERVYRPIARGMDIVVLQWQSGYAFLVNNPNCTTIRITDHTKTRDIAIEATAYPYLIFYERIPSEYVFLDADGNEIP